MTREDFIAAYIASFLAGHNANVYLDKCADGTAGDLADPDSIPFEDAECMAEAAWEAYTRKIDAYYRARMASKPGGPP